MARTIKKGLDYFPFDVDFFDDDKVQLISSEFGPDGEMITIKLLCKIYKQGYFYNWNQDEQLLFAKKSGYKHTLVNEVVKRLIKRSFFNEGVFNSFQILTSRGILKRYLEAKIRAKDVELIAEYLTLPENECKKYNNVYINSINDSINTQRREDKSKEEKKKEEYVREEIFETEVLSFFGFARLGQHYEQEKKITAFCAAQFFAGRLEYFKTQFYAYRDYVAIIGSGYKKKFNGFLGSQENAFNDGTWNEENWQQKVLERRSTSRQQSQTVESKSEASERRRNELLSKIEQNGH